jgi:hypothetical protein
LKRIGNLLPGLSLRSNPGLKLANAYGVTSGWAVLFGGLVRENSKMLLTVFVN